MRRNPLCRLVDGLIGDETANTLPEFAIVIALLTIMSIAAFGLFTNAATSAVTGDTNRMVTSGLGNYAP